MFEDDKKGLWILIAGLIVFGLICGIIINQNYKNRQAESRITDRVVQSDEKALAENSEPMNYSRVSSQWNTIERNIIKKVDKIYYNYTNEKEDREGAWYKLNNRKETIQFMRKKVSCSTPPKEIESAQRYRIDSWNELEIAVDYMINGLEGKEPNWKAKFKKHITTAKTKLATAIKIQKEFGY
jgi:hypothetical protein